MATVFIARRLIDQAPLGWLASCRRSDFVVDGEETHRDDLVTDHSIDGGSPVTPEWIVQARQQLHRAIVRCRAEPLPISTSVRHYDRRIIRRPLWASHWFLEGGCASPAGDWVLRCVDEVVFCIGRGSSATSRLPMSAKQQREELAKPNQLSYLLAFQRLLIQLTKCGRPPTLFRLLSALSHQAATQVSICS